MSQIDPNLSAENFALELAGLQEAIFVLHASFSAKIFRPIWLISIRKHYISLFHSFGIITDTSEWGNPQNAYQKRVISVWNL